MDTQIDINNATQICSGLRAIVDGTKLILIVDMKNDVGHSHSGKMRGVVSTGGFTNLPDGLRGNIYIGRKA